MDLPVLVEQGKKIADIRNQLTPGGDGSCDEIGSEEEDSYYEKKTIKQFQVNDQQEQWEDTSVLQEGQSLSLLPVNDVKEPKDKEQVESIQPLQPSQQKEPQKKERKERHRNYGQRQMKAFSVPYDSKFIFAAYELLYEELKKQIPLLMGFLKFNPYINTNEILIYYYDDKDKGKLADIIDDHINELQVMEMSKIQAESGIQLSYKYRQQLFKQKISIFKDKSQNFKNASYYICGYKVKKNILYQKISEIKKIHFTWMHLFRFQNTRSYRAILRKIFETPQMHAFVLQKFKAKQIQIASLKKDFPLPTNIDKKGTLIILTIQGEKKVAIHQQIQHEISGFIRQNFLIFCFSFIRRKQSYKYQYTPKVDKVIWFFIEEKNTKLPLSYLYIILNKKDFEEVKGTIIKEIEIMKLDINGRRFFKCLYPDLKDKQPNKEYFRIFSFPRVRPYSWTLSSPKGVKFDWASQLSI